MYQRINSICTTNVNTTPISTDAITVSSNILICYHTTLQCLLLVIENNVLLSVDRALFHCTETHIIYGSFTDPAKARLRDIRIF